MKIFLIIILSIIGIVLLFCSILAVMFFYHAVYRKPPRVNEKLNPKSHHAQLLPKRLECREWIAKQKLVEESITSFDGLKLVADTFEPNQKSKKVAILMHGFRSQDYDDFSLSIKYFLEDGYNLIVPYERAHGKSDGKFLTFGVKERYDCKDWIDFAIKKYGEDCEIVLMGVSMGCATVLMTLGFDLPKNVKLCIADCGYTTPRAIFEVVLVKDYNLPTFPIMNICSFVAKQIADFDMNGYTVKQALEHNKIPVLFIHGDKDTFVPEYMTHENYEDCKAEKELLIVKGAEHAVAFLRQPELCWDKIKGMMNKYIKGE